MKHSLLFWLRKAHCWAGVYLSVVTLIWLVEIVALPLVHDPGVEVVRLPAVTPAPAEEDVLPVQDVLARFRREQTNSGSLTPDAATFLPGQGLWVIRDSRRYVSVTYDAHTGAMRERVFDATALVADKNGLAWLSPVLGETLKISFQPLFVILCVTGVCLLWRRKRHPVGGKEQPAGETEQPATLVAVRAQEACVYERAHDPCLGGRLAAIGFLPGGVVRVLRNAGRGPLLVLARHTRVALGRGVAASIMVKRKG